VEASNHILEHAVGIDNPFVLAKMFETGLDKERLKHATFDRGVLKYPPGVSAIAPALPAQLIKGSQKCISLYRVDLILDGDQHGSAIVLDLAGDDRCRPMHGGCQIETAGHVKLPAPGERYGYEYP